MRKTQSAFLSIVELNRMSSGNQSTIIAASHDAGQPDQAPPHGVAFTHYFPRDANEESLAVTVEALQNQKAHQIVGSLVFLKDLDNWCYIKSYKDGKVSIASALDTRGSRFSAGQVAQRLEHVVFDFLSCRADGAGPTDGDGSAQRRGDGDRCALRRADGVSAQRRADEEHRGDGDTADQREHRAGKASRAYRAGSAPRRTDEVSRGAGEDSAEPAPKRSKDTHAGRSDEAGGAGHQRGAAGGAEPSASHSAPKRSKRAKSPQAGPGSGSDDDPSSARRGKRRARRQSDSEFSDSGDSTDTSQQAGSAVRTAKFLITDRLRPQSTSRRDTLIAFFAAASQLVLDLGGLDERVLRRLKDRQQAVDEAFLERFEVALGRISATLGCLWIPRAPPSNITRVGAIREEVVKLMYEASLEKVRPKGRSRRHHSSSDSEADGSPHRRGAPSRESREARELGMKDRLKALHLELASSLRAADAVAQIDALADEAVVFGLSALPEHFRKDIQRVALSNRRVYASGASRNAQQLPHSVLKIADATEGCIRTALE